MNVVPLELPEDADALRAFLSAHRWPHHGRQTLTPEQVSEWINEGMYTADYQETFWLEKEGERVGLLRLMDLDDIANHGFPLFDLRIAESQRGRGLGTAAVRWLTNYLFGKHPTLNRIEANTRADNTAMQRVLDRCGYVREGFYREAWPDHDSGEIHDSVHYAIIRRDWRDGTRTPVRVAD